YERVREGYLEIASEEPFRFRVLDANGEEELLASKVAQLALREVKKKLPDPGRLSFGRPTLE
ncbi:MAG: hypothetical protein KC910_06090, partial [Candidatus Eremiobacteraeota bacterium]|nr:hypothetical protein [Candidatus Eremiobacteraeota bacterium]